MLYQCGGMSMKILFVIVASFLATAAIGQKIPSKLIGKWEAVDSDNQGIGLEIKDSTEIYVVYGEEKKRVTSFKADFSRTPAFFDFSVKDSSEVIQLKSLINLVNDDLVQWQLFDGPSRPDMFTEKQGEMVYMRRKK
jgi:hypothetical protein